MTMPGPFFDASGSTAPGEATDQPRRKRGRGQLLLVAAGVLIIVLVVAAVFAPTLAGSLAPGMIERVTAQNIRGTVKVHSLSIGWFSPITIGPIELRDPAGKAVASLEAATTVTLMDVMRERWWSASAIDFRTVEVSGRVDAERDASGRSNLQQALEPDQPKAVGGGGGSGAGAPAQQGSQQAIKGTIRITNLDLAVRDVVAGGAPSQEIGVKGLKGDVSVDAGPGAILAKADLSATPVGQIAGSAPLRVVLDANIKPSTGAASATGFETASVKGEITGAPIALVDGLAGLGGAMVSAIGTTADVRVNVSGNTQAATAQIAIRSEGSNGDFDLALRDGVLSAAGSGSAAAPATTPASPNRLTVKSLDFLARLPALRPQFAEAAKSVRLDGPAPGLEFSLESLALPLPPQVLSGRAPFNAGAIDFRKASAVARAAIGPVQGRVALAPEPANAGNDGGASGDWRPFRVERTEIALNLADFVQGGSLTAGTRATLDGQPAGEISLKVAVRGLLDQQGHLRAMNGGLADKVDAEARIAGMSTALAQPLTAGLGIPLDLRQDVGPTLDLEARAWADTASGVPAPGELPPATIDVRAKSANLQLAGAGRIEKNTITSTGEGVSLTINSAGPALARMLSSQSPTTDATADPAPALSVSGVGRTELTLKDFAADLGKLKSDAPLSGLKATVTGAIHNLEVKSSALGADAAPISARAVTLGAALAPGAPPKLTLNADLAHQNQPFAAMAELSLDGLANGRLPKGGGLDAAFSLGARGRASLDNVPTSVFERLPALAAYLAPPPAESADLSAQIARAVRATIGPSATVAVTLAPAPGAAAGTQATLKASTPTNALAADLGATITNSVATVSTLSLALDVNPDTVNPVLAAQSAPGTPPMRIAAPFKLTLAAAEPITVPLVARDGALQPDFARAGDAKISLNSQGNLTIDNLRVGADEAGQTRATQLTLANLAAQVTAPLSGLAPGGDTKRAAAKATATLSQGGGARLAEFALDASASMSGQNPEGTVRLGNVDTAGLDTLLGRPGLLAGALGDRADLSARATPQRAGAATLITAEVNAPRLQNASMTLSHDGAKTALVQPTKVTWTPDAAFLNSMLARGPGPESQKPSASAKPASLRVTRIDPVTIQLNSLALAASTSDAAGKPASGPLLPGVFALDAEITTPAISMLATEGANADGKARPDTPVAMEGVRLAAKSIAGATPGITADMSIARIAGESAKAGGGSPKPSTVRASARNLADAQGILTTDRAIYDLQADVEGFPTAIVDQVGNQGGVLVELLGPTVDAKATAQNVALASGDSQGALQSGLIDVRATSARASAELKGEVRDGALIQSGPLSAQIVEIRPQFVQVLRGGLPVVESVTKTRTDAPAVIQADALHLPLDGDMRKLNGHVRVDPGVAQFQVKNVFGDLISALGGKSAGAVGEKLEPFVVHFDKGVATYERFALPVGSFTLETKGTVDLVQRQVDVITYVPLFALTDRAAGGLNTGLAGKLSVLDKNTLVPIRTRGSMDKPKTEIDAGMFAQETAGNLIKAPGELIKKGLDDIFNPKPKPEATPAPEPAPAPAPAAAPKPKPKPKKK